MSARRRGRERHYRLDARPLLEIYESYLRAFEPVWEESLKNLKRVVETPPAHAPSGQPDA